MAVDKFMSEMHLKQPEFTYSACGPFTKHFERIWTFRETGNLRHLCRKELDNACFARDAAYSDSKRFFDKKSESGISVNENLADELHKPVIKKFQKKKKSLCKI